MIPLASKCAFVLALVGAAHTASAFAVVLSNDIEHTKVTIADYPGQRGAFLVAWQDVPGVTPASGAMVYYADRASDETRYFAIGGHGKFALINSGRGRLIRGTATAVFELIADDPKHPIGLVADTSQTVDVPALLAQYAAFENIAAASETRAAIEAAVTARAAQTNRTCKSQLAPKLDWKTFAAPASLRLAKQTVSILDAIEAACADKDYAAAIRTVSELRVDYQADAGALRLERTGAALAVRLSDTSFNPRETTRQWLTDHL
jgi:hypothetical protein